MKSEETAPLFLKVIFVILALSCFLPFVSGSVALIGGMVLGLFLGNPFSEASRKISKKLLMISVVGLGAGTNLAVVAKVGLRGLGYTVIGISLTLFVGLVLGRALKVGRQVALLISVGTAICGGSAIAAVAPVSRAKSHDITVAMAIVFLLNGIALLFFPWLGHILNLSQRSFGLWSALAIHDTSSVVGATMAYGREALEIGTTVKLARALWIAPVALIISYVFSHFIKTEQEDESSSKAKMKINFPWFILGFIALAAFFSAFPQLSSLGQGVAALARRALVVTLFFIGSQISRQSLKEVGVAPLIQGVLLWLMVGSATLEAIMLGWIS